ALKMPMGHLVDLLWRHKVWFVVLGASLIAMSLCIMLGLLARPEFMRAWLPAEHWYVLAALLAPIGYMMQDTVADAMTVEAIPQTDTDGHPLSADRRRVLNTTMQTLGRMAIIGGSILVSAANVALFNDVDQSDPEATRAVYIQIYQLALMIPLISLAGVALAAIRLRRRIAVLMATGIDLPTARQRLRGIVESTEPNWWILGGSAVFVTLTIAIGLSSLTYGQEAIFLGSTLVIGALMWHLLGELHSDARRTLLGTAIIIFVFRALPGPGAGSTWWMIDVLDFDQAFLARLSLVASVLTLLGLFAFRRMMAERSIAYIVGLLTIVGFILGLPILGMYYGLHEWTAAITGGLVDARSIALIDTALESPLGQISMVPMLAWIAISAPPHLKATFFAVMASFTNLALSASQLGTKYLNQIFVVTREVKDSAGTITVGADYSELGTLLILVSLVALSLPFLTIALTRAFKLRSA
ncbi:MAG: hypothetical protein ACREXT_07715, partial [Gammaproteobacteria bacterium]